MAVVEEHIVPPHTPPVRLVDYLPGIFTLLPSRAGLKKAMKRGEVLVNGKPAAQREFVQPGQKISLLEPAVPTARIFEFPLEIVYKDEWLAIINKPAGLPVSGNRYRTVQNALPFNLPESSKKDALKWPRPVHRLDVPTSGLLLIARTTRALMILGRQMEKREIKKRYRAIVAGKLSGSGKIDWPIQNRK
ncbi:MAG: RluA family pseudouridine synthase, partial [bacterium]